MRSLVAPIALTSLLLAACGDDGGSTPTDARRVDAAIIDSMVADAPTDSVEVDAPLDAIEIDAADIDAADIDAADIDAGDIDATEIDASTIDALPAVGAHLLITEVKMSENSEFIEIYNPTDQTIQLRNYYLTDHQTYFTLPGVIAGNTTRPAENSDFLARFPVGAAIAPRGVITVATDAIGFEAGLSVVPTYTVQELGNSIAMEDLWMGPTPSPGLTNGGEMVVLFFWDGVTDTVKDVDIAISGVPSAINNIIAKTPVDGPDADTNTTDYAADMPNALFNMQTAAPVGATHKRILLESGQEIQLGTGNGITGDDETSESLRTTWDSQAVATGYTAPTPGAVPATINP